MIRRVIAAIVAILLAVVGFVLVLNYANRADERAMEGMETDEVLVASETIPRGTSAEDIADLVETRAVPRTFQVGEPVTDLDDLAGRVAVAEIAAGEQLQQARFATAEQLRGRGDYQLPEGAQNLHQVTVPLPSARALGGNVAPGDTVGVFISLDANFNSGLYVDEDGNVQFSDEVDSSTGDDEGGQGTDSVSLSLTKLVLEKVLVTRVQGGFVPSSTPSEDEDDEGEAEPANEILVTLALEGGQAEQLVYGMEFGNVWLSYEPETAEEDDEDVKVVQLPDRVGNVLE
ncbi:MAG TPA: RcpC/CpaB family pilus assembly protein [Jiangellaceae bacterium]